MAVVPGTTVEALVYGGAGGPSGWGSKLKDRLSQHGTQIVNTPRFNQLPIFVDSYADAVLPVGTSVTNSLIHVPF
jgi:hypothetical protein